MTAALVESIDTPDGVFTLIADPEGRVLASGWAAEPERIVARLRPAARPAGRTTARTAAGEAVRAYYDGDLHAIDGVEVSAPGTSFQTGGWDLLRAIPPGAPLTYAAFAAALGAPGAVRAAASVCARNPAALFVPCHRVLRTGGALGGFAWGVEVKRALLAREGGVDFASTATAG